MYLPSGEQRGFVESIRDLQAEPKRFVVLQTTPSEPVGERLTFDALHDEKADPVLVTDIMRRYEGD